MKFSNFVILVNLFATLGSRMALKWAHCWTPWVNQHPHWYHGKNLKNSFKLFISITNLARLNKIRVSEFKSNIF